jgi:hypothetical protein
VGHLGKAVAQKYGNSLRVGVVVDQIKNARGWSYVEVAWINDEEFQAVQDDNLDHNKVFYRIDEVFFFDPSLIASSLNKLRSKIRMKKF